MSSQPDKPPTGPAPTATPRAPRPALPPAEPALQQRAVAALFVALLSLAGLMGLNNLTRGAYVAGFALLAGVVAIWLGVTAMIRARRSGAASPRGSLVAALIGALGLLMSTVLLLMFAVLGRQLAQYSHCLSGANTISSQQSCYNTVVHQINALRATGRP